MFSSLYVKIWSEKNKFHLYFPSHFTAFLLFIFCYSLTLLHRMKLSIIWIIIHVGLLPYHVQSFMSVSPKLFFYQEFLWHVSQLPRAFFTSCSLFSSHWCCLALLTHLQTPSLSTGSWYHPSFHSSPNRPSLLPLRLFIILFPASSEYIFLLEFHCFSRKKEMRVW